MSPRPATEPESFTLQQLMDKINTLIPTINGFMGDIGSGADQWKKIRKDLIMLGKSMYDMDENLKITNPALVRNYNDLNLEKIQKMNLEQLRIQISDEFEASKKIQKNIPTGDEKDNIEKKYKNEIVSPKDKSKKP